MSLAFRRRRDWALGSETRLKRFSDVDFMRVLSDQRRRSASQRHAYWNQSKNQSTYNLDASSSPFW